MQRLTVFMFFVTIAGCSTNTPPCSKYLHEFFEYAADEDMNIGKVVVEQDKIAISAFNNKEVKIFCMIGTNANYEATKCTARSDRQGVCRYKDGRFMGYSVGTASAQDLLDGVK